MSANRPSSDTSAAAPGRVVVGVHGSRSSWRALQYAAGAARDRGWSLEIVTAWPDADDPLIRDVPGRYIAARGHAVECQRKALATLGPMAADVDTFVVNARPVPALLARCGDADLLVVGAGRPEQGRGRRSVGADCLEAAPCQVMIVQDPVAEHDDSSDRHGGRRRRQGRVRDPKAGAAAKH